MKSSPRKHAQAGIPNQLLTLHNAQQLITNACRGALPPHLRKIYWNFMLWGKMLARVKSLTMLKANFTISLGLKRFNYVKYTFMANAESMLNKESRFCTATSDD